MVQRETGAQRYRIDLGMRAHRVAKNAEVIGLHLATQVQLVSGDAELHRVRAPDEERERKRRHRHPRVCSSARSSAARSAVMRPACRTSGIERSAIVQ